MGLGEGINGGDWGGPGDYSGFGKEFLTRFNPGCAGRVDQCWDAAMTLVKVAGADAAYNVFGIMFIESDPGGSVARGMASVLNGGRAAGGDALGAIINNPRGKRLRGVLGESLGAITVSEFYANPAHSYVRVPFFLDAAPNFHKCIGIGVGPCVEVNILTTDEAAEAHKRYAGTYGFWHGGGSCDINFHGIGHCVSNGAAGDVFDRLADKEQ
jgi:hypothetical protein